MSKVESSMSKSLSADDSDSFWLKFNEEVTAVQVSITELDVEEIVPTKKHLVKLQAFATDCTSILPAYDIKRAQEILDEVRRLLVVREEQLKPKKKFRFKSRDKVKNDKKGNKVITITDTDTDAISLSSSSSTTETENETCYNVKNKNDEEIILDSDILGSHCGAIRSLLIKDCKNTIIYARCVLGSVRIEDCCNCTFYLGPTKTSIYLNGLKTCIAFLASHQLRIHECENCNLCVRANSHPIIEDCKGMGFAPYTVEYNDITKHFQDADLSQARCWDNVVDFRWHRSTASPNWRVLLSSERPIAKTITEKDGSITVWGTPQEVVSSSIANKSNNVIDGSVFASMELANAAKEGDANANAGGDSDDEM
jgi:tubulin-specific chaperone C